MKSTQKDNYSWALSRGQSFKIRACCGCGGVAMDVGSTTLKFSKEAFRSLVEKVNEVAAEMEREKAEPPYQFPLVVSAAGKIPS